MGKLKRPSKLAQRRQKAKRLQRDASPKQPVGKPADQALQAKVAPLMLKLKSASPEEKLLAINSINLLCDSNIMFRRAFLRNDLVRVTLSQLIHDTNNQVVVDGYGLLRNLMVDEGYSMCIHLWRSDIWTSLADSFQKVGEGIKQAGNESEKDLVVNLVANLLACLDCLGSELPLKTFEEDILEKMKKGGVLDFMFALLKEKPDPRLVLSSLETLYDLCSLSYKFIEEITANTDYTSALESCTELTQISKCYHVGILLQVMDSKDEIKDRKKLFEAVLAPLEQVYKNVDLQFTVSQLNLPSNANPTPEDAQKLAVAKDNFKIIDLILELYASCIEMVAETKIERVKRDPVIQFFTKNLQQTLSELVQAEFKDDKLMTCLDNYCVLSASVDLQNMNEVLQFLESVHPKLSTRFNEIMESAELSEETLFEVNQHLNFTCSFIDMEDIDQWNIDAAQVTKLIGLSSQLAAKVNSGDIDPETFLQFNQHLIHYLTKIGKNCENLEITKDVSKFLVDQKFLKYIEESKSFKSAEKLHKKWGFLLEDTLNLAVNAVFELFDDDYDYNRPIFHEGGLLQVLREQIPQYTKIYKAVDKNVNLEVKKRTEETLQNLKRFIEYKEGELA